jgi:drug/metabolite transporter (DMT)-like permease
MGILLALTAAMSWGVSEFLIRHVARLIGSYSTLLFIQFISLICLSVYLIDIGTLQWLVQHTSWQPWAWTLLAILLNMTSSLCLYHAYEIGVLAVISPIAASYSAVTALLAMVSGEAISMPHGIGMGITLAGIVLASTSLGKRAETRTVSHTKHERVKIAPEMAWAAIAAVGYGVFFWLLGLRVTPVLGGVVPVWFCRLTTLCLLPLLAPVLRQRICFPQGRVWWCLIGIAVLDTAAYLTTAIGFTVSQTSLVTILSSLYSSVTFLLAWIFLREPMHWSQWLGIGTIFVGIILVNI